MAKKVPIYPYVPEALRDRLKAAARRRVLSESLLTEIALETLLDRIDAEDASVIGARHRRELLRAQ